MGAVRLGLFPTNMREEGAVFKVSGCQDWREVFLVKEV